MPGRARRRWAGAGPALVAVVVSLTAGGCSSSDAICGDDEYSALFMGSTAHTCVPRGQEPPEGYRRYPAGTEPKREGDEWDRYWSKHSLDEQGRLLS
ncbi:SCO0607 family lipoprotein [Streptomyces sp. NPDC058045]|uniref:SCO0607 family lipoprotein n=1 Tax=Streptomyces sp. NPDC058045 TaxID=3346311 RepID=UPI0036E09F7C